MGREEATRAIAAAASSFHCSIVHWLNNYRLDRPPSILLHLLASDAFDRIDCSRMFVPFFAINRGRENQSKLLSLQQSTTELPTDQQTLLLVKFNRELLGLDRRRGRRWFEGHRWCDYIIMSKVNTRSREEEWKKGVFVQRIPMIIFLLLGSASDRTICL